MSKSDPGAGGEVFKLAALASERSSGVLERALAAAREHLGMEVAFVAEFSGTRLEFRTLEGDAESFGFKGLAPKVGVEHQMW